jgi:hypothetical protein
MFVVAETSLETGPPKSGAARSGSGESTGRTLARRLPSSHEPRATRRAFRAATTSGCRASALLALAAVLLAACGAKTPRNSLPPIPRSLLRAARPIGVGPRFQPPVSGSPVGRCRRELGSRRGVHVEIFAADRVVIVPAGIGTIGLRRLSDGQITRARCYGALVTLDPTGVILVRAGQRLTLSDLFRAWGQPLGTSRLASFRAAPGTHVTVFVGGRLWHGAPGRVPLTPHSEIVVETGPHVPPHTSFTFPPST